ncbi:MAG: hypothetical protein A3C35_04895 [Omnitrophica bacterium RIFCSPHIGHO2_02_FULL_46_11]|nr:MAG: hypothetical protein A3C35_04895 [Omnitrophica bacterium RIFCSPHIGHO2_02_FULL_46_11]OGW87775.1 MAG: hypothetical protein A3A81_01585 [Omnitrophica bacterium RIFCSPLOWO2_01_FULL_45_10b]
MKLRKVRIRTIEFLQYLTFRVLCFLLNLIPFDAAMALGRWGGRLLYAFLSKYRRVALENLHFAFAGVKTEDEIKKVALQSFENLGYFAIELIRIPKIVKDLKKYIKIQNEETVFKALERGKGVILIVSHFGNWEWMGVAAGKRVREKGVTINAIARVLGNLFLYRYAVKKLRGATGLRTVDKKGAAREAVKLLEQNEIVCVLIDQHERYGSVPVPYFGRDAWTTSLPAVMALKKGAAVIPVFSFREKGKPTIVKLGEAFRAIETGDYERDVIANTAQYVKAIEEVVRKRPADWLWMHARWRSSRTEKLR